MTDEPWLRVMTERCETCIFGPHSPVSAERFAELRKLWEQRGAEHYQVCHHSAVGDIDDEDEMATVLTEGVVCRGWYDEFYVRRGTPVAAIQIAERLGHLGWADPRDFPL
jgi:hypothetical protein